MTKFVNSQNSMLHTHKTALTEVFLITLEEFWPTTIHLNNATSCLHKITLFTAWLLNQWHIWCTIRFTPRQINWTQQWLDNFPALRNRAQSTPLSKTGLNIFLMYDIACKSADCSSLVGQQSSETVYIALERSTFWNGHITAGTYNIRRASSRKPPQERKKQNCQHVNNNLAVWFSTKKWT